MKRRNQFNRNQFNRNLDDKRYYCECVVYTTDLEDIIEKLKQPTDYHHEIVYIIKSEFLKQNITEMRMSGQNKDFLCDYLVEIKYNNGIKTVTTFTDINIEITFVCPHNKVIEYIPDKTYVLCASFGIINEKPRLQFGFTESAKRYEIEYSSLNKIPDKPHNNNWKMKVATRGLKEEIGLFEQNISWDCINEELFNWNRYRLVATLIYCC